MQRVAPTPLTNHPAARPARGGWSPRDAVMRLRDRIVSDPRFQDFAQRFWLTRPIARRRAKSLFDLCAGFVYSQVLAACLRLDLFATLKEGPLTREEIARRADLPADAADRLIDAAVALSLLDRRSRGRIGLGPHGAALIGNPAVAAMIAHHDLFYRDLADPVAALRGGRGAGELARFWAYATSADSARLPEDAVAPYSALMAESQPLVARQVLDSYPLSGRRRLMDVGGGAGAFLAEAGRRHPHLELVLFDLPAVAALAERRFAQEGLSERASVVGGSFFADDLPAGADVVSLVRILHDHDDAQALAILRKARKALPEGGALLIAEPMSGGGVDAVTDAYFGLYLHVMGSGRPRTAETLADMAREAGFRDFSLRPSRIPLVASIAVASA